MLKLEYKKQKKALIIRKILDSLYPNPKSSLYHINEYTLLIAIILSAKSRENKVNEVTGYLFEIIKKPKDFIMTPTVIIKKYLRNIGLYNRKYNHIYNLSNILLKEYKGIIPKNIYQLESLPGVGHKTASVFLSHVSEIPVFPVDTHIHRMMFRWKLSDGKNVKKTEKDAKSIFKKIYWKKLHFQIINYGREYSPSINWNKNTDIIYKKLLINNLL